MNRWRTLALLLLLALRPAAAQQPVAERADLISDAELGEMAAEISRTVERLRGLSFQQPFQKGIKNRAELRDFIILRLHEEMPPERIQAYQKVLRAVGKLAEAIEG